MPNNTRAQIDAEFRREMLHPGVLVLRKPKAQRRKRPKAKETVR